MGPARWSIYGKAASLVFLSQGSIVSHAVTEQVSMQFQVSFTNTQPRTTMHHIHVGADLWILRISYSCANTRRLPLDPRRVQPKHEEHAAWLLNSCLEEVGLTSVFTLQTPSASSMQALSTMTHNTLAVQEHSRPNAEPQH
jgi:hypothetical protein